MESVPKLVKDINPSIWKKSDYPNYDKGKNSHHSQNATTKDKVLTISRKRKKQTHRNGERERGKRKIGREEGTEEGRTTTEEKKKKVRNIPCWNYTTWRKWGDITE